MPSMKDCVLGFRERQPRTGMISGVGDQTGGHHGELERAMTQW